MKIFSFPPESSFSGTFSRGNREACPATQVKTAVIKLLLWLHAIFDD